jgi:Domain of unknown function (DUF4190)/GYF domain 2
MYKIVGADGREYGPVDVEQIRKWITEGRVNAQTQVRRVDEEGRKSLTQFPELAALLQQPARNIPPLPATPPPATMPSRIRVSRQVQDLAVISLILGILSLVCLLLTAIPAVICGHIARRRAKADPERVGGAGLALAGMVIGYLGIVLSLVLPFVVLPGISKSRRTTAADTCTENLEVIGLAFRQWALDNSNQFPWAVSTNNGGTMELAMPAADHIDPNPIHFEIVSNELDSAKVLICPSDPKNVAAFQFLNLRSNNVSYELHTGSNVSGTNPHQIMVTCPIHGNVLTCDGSVRQEKGRKK